VPAPQEILDLAGTNWQLVGLADAATGQITIPCPEDHNGAGAVYRMGFFEGGRGLILFYCTHFRLNFSRTPVVLWKYNFGPCPDYMETLLDMACTIESCKHDNNELKLFCNNNRNYLLFETLQQ
jgi:hypothetical protein